MNRLFSCVLLLIFSLQSIIAQEEVAKLPLVVAESSALICVRDSLLITLNDSGNQPKLFVLTKKGELLHTVRVENTENEDWEALAFDGENRLFIGDIGNNANKRKELAIYMVSLDEVLANSEVKAEKITFHYPEQTAFPPEKDALYYDAEALIYKNERLFIFTKNRTVPFDGVVQVYALEINPGEQIAQLQPPIALESSSWMEDSVTDAWWSHDTLFLLTYAHIYFFESNEHEWQQIGRFSFDAASQKEGICYDGEYIYITDERSILGKGKLYRLAYPF